MKKAFSGEEILLEAKNIFNLQNPESFDCQVEQYWAGDKILIVRVEETSQTEDKNNRFYLVFSPVNYFDGPTSWKGASFYVGSSEEIMNIFHRPPSLIKVPDEFLPNASDASSSTLGTLFMVGSPNVLVKLVANEVILTDDITEWKFDYPGRPNG